LLLCILTPERIYSTSVAAEVKLETPGKNLTDHSTINKSSISAAILRASNVADKMRTKCQSNLTKAASNVRQTMRALESSCSLSRDTKEVPNVKVGHWTQSPPLYNLLLQRFG